MALVWGHRFGGSPEAALAKGLAGFIVFHSAFAREPWATRLIFGAFPVASPGAIGAAFKYDDVSG